MTRNDVARTLTNCLLTMAFTLNSFQVEAVETDPKCCPGPCCPSEKSVAPAAAKPAEAPAAAEEAPKAEAAKPGKKAKKAKKAEGTK